MHVVGPGTGVSVVFSRACSGWLFLLSRCSAGCWSPLGCRSVMVMDALWRSLCSNGPLFVFLSHSAADVDACGHLQTSIFILFLFSVHQSLWTRQVNQCSHCYSLKATLFCVLLLDTVIIQARKRKYLKV